MKRLLSLLVYITALSSCTAEIDQLYTSTRKTPDKTPVFYATTESSSVPDTKTFADSQMRVLWNEGDQITIFNKITYGRGFEFDGEDGDTAGGFNPFTQLPEFVYWGDLDYVYAIYPYNTKNKSDYDGNLTVTLPTKQLYKENSFGIGANTMAAVSEGSRLQFKIVGGYLSLRLYGDNVKVKSITIKGNNGEKIAGKATVTIPLGGAPTTVMDESATDAITISCEPAVQLGTDANHYTDFWFVIPPVTFTNGFKITVTDDQGGVFEKTTTHSLTVVRNQLDWMDPLKVTISYENFIIDFKDPLVKSICVANWDTSGDGALSYEEAAAVTDLGDVFEYTDITSFNELQYFTGLTELDGTFNQCIFLSEITLPSSLMGVGANAFCGCSNLTEIAIPSGVTYIGRFAFYGCSNLTEIAIPSGVTSIGRVAFYKCTSLTEITIPSGVTSIEEGSFFGCSNLTEITIPSSVTSIGQSAFENCTSLTEITIPSGVTGMMGSTFEGCTSLTEIAIPSGVTRIYNTFNGCTSLTTVSIPSDSRLTSIGGSAFYHCTSLTEITIPSRVTSIEDFAFVGCTNLTEITIPSGVTSIEGYVFKDCTSLTTVSIPSNSRLTSIGVQAFYDCTSLTEITIPSGVTSIGDYTFYYCTSLTEITIPSGVTSMESYVFQGCTSLTTVSIPSNSRLTSIGVQAFYNCTSLTEITIPSGVTKIEDRAFHYCSNLTKFTALPTIPPSVGAAILGGSSCAIQVPSPSVDAYKTATGWSDYASRIQAIPE